jgi:hypothetical protein
MASGDPVARIIRWQPPAANFATESWVLGGSTNNEIFNLWKFGLSTQLDLMCVAEGLPGAASSLTIRIPWYCSVTTASKTVQFRAGLRRHSTSDYLTASHTYGWINMTATAIPTGNAYTPTYSSWTISSTAFDSLADGEDFTCRIERLSTVANPTGDVYLGWGVRLLEV